MGHWSNHSVSSPNALFSVFHSVHCPSSPVPWHCVVAPHYMDKSVRDRSKPVSPQIHTAHYLVAYYHVVVSSPSLETLLLPLDEDRHCPLRYRHHGDRLGDDVFHCHQRTSCGLYDVLNDDAIDPHDQRTGGERHGIRMVAL